MFRLTREVRFGVNPDENGQLQQKPTNSFGAFPSLLGIGHYFTIEVTLLGDVKPDTGCLRNIKDIDQIVRQDAIPLVSAFVRRGRFLGGGFLISKLYDLLKDRFTDHSILHHVRLTLTPQMRLTCFAREFPMVRLCQKFEFSASHRLHNPALSDAQNQEIFGKCNNPHGHGHNYIVQVTLAGKPDNNGVVIDVPKFEQIVSSTVIDKFDHRNLNIEIPEFSDLIPTVENISMVIYRLLKPEFAKTNVKLAGVTVWETPKTWCEYME
jgi:6-pyruvoyltetrahydropterin/6-carboxytetrahydropterin synthase